MLEPLGLHEETQGEGMCYHDIEEAFGVHN